MPLLSHEVRWFFPGPLARFPELRDWMESAAPFPKEGDVPPPRAVEREGGEPEVYVVVPGARDLGLKWREGQLQVKGRLSAHGIQRFAGRFYGAVEVWAKWSYAGNEVKKALGSWFAAASGDPWETVEITKSRILRKTRLDAWGRFVEVSPEAYPDRGLSVELTDLEAQGQRFCSLAFEAWPDDSGMAASFTAAVDAWLSGLAGTGAVLAEHQSMGYPEFLARVWGVAPLRSREVATRSGSPPR